MKHDYINIHLSSLHMYRKHQCPLHHSWTRNLILDDHLKKTYHPKTHYQITFQSAQGDRKACKPGLKVPPRILPNIPKKNTELVSVNHTDFVKLPIVPRKSFKPDEKAHECEARLEDRTSYRLDFPLRKPHPNPAAETLMRTTMPRTTKIPSKEHYITTNQDMLQNWDKKGRQEGFREHPTQLYFEGKFDGRSVHKEDFSAPILRNGKPSTSCKREEQTHVSNGQFYGTTTNKSMHSSLPTLVERQPVYLKKRSKTNRETMKPLSGSIQRQTQYRLDNPGYVSFPPVRTMCTPAPDPVSYTHLTLPTIYSV